MGYANKFWRDGKRFRRGRSTNSSASWSGNAPTTGMFSTCRDDIDIYVIDIGRARVQSDKLSGRARLVDLMRICYKLDWNDRERFIQSYNRALGKEVSSLWRLPLQYYEAKQTIKKSVKKKLGLK